MDLDLLTFISLDLLTVQIWDFGIREFREFSLDVSLVEDLGIGTFGIWGNGDLRMRKICMLANLEFCKFKQIGIFGT